MPIDAGGRSIAGVARSGRGCSGSPATPRSTSCAGASGVATLLVDPEALGEEETADDGPDVTLRRTAVRTALAAMSARDRELIALKFHAGLSNAELAQVLGVSESNAGTMLHRTVQKLRKACNATV